MSKDRPASPESGWLEERRFYYDRLRRRIRWRLLAAYAIPFILLSAYFHHHYSAGLRKEIDIQLKSEAENKRNTVDLYLQERVLSLKYAFRVNFSPAPGKADMAAILDSLRYDSPSIVDLGLFSADGVQIAYAGPHPALLGKSYKNEHWFKRLMGQEQDHFISDVYLGFRRSPHFIIAIRRLAEGKEYILRASFDPEEFGKFVGRSEMIEEGEAYIINRLGQRQTISPEESLKEIPLAAPTPTHHVHVTKLEIDGRDYISAFAWLHQTDWAVVVTLPADKAFAPIRRARLELLGLAGLALMIIIVLVISGTRKLVDRLEISDIEKLGLKELNEEKNRFIGIAAHDLRNPLSAIMGYCEILLDEGRIQLDDELYEMLDLVCTSSKFMLNLVNELLDISKIEAGKLELEIEPTDLKELVKKNVKLNGLMAARKEIRVDVDCDADLPPAPVDRQKIEQVLNNLISNAIKYSHSRTTIRVSLKRDGNRVRLTVADQGQGIPEDEMKHLFKPFGRTNVKTTAGERSTGLGLAIVRKIVEGHGGTIEVESKVGRGTSFIVTLQLGI